jgi:hypothetical protein
MRKWQKNLYQSVLKRTLKPITVLFAADQLIITENEDNLQKAAYRLMEIVMEYNLLKKVKLSLCLTNEALRHEDMWEWIHRTVFS